MNPVGKYGKEIRSWAAFTLGLAVLLFFMDALLDKGLRDCREGSVGVWNRVVTGRVNADVLICGSSRGANHYDSHLLSEILGMTCFNMSVNASCHNIQFPWMKAYINHNKKPKLIIQNVDLTSGETDSFPYNAWQHVPFLKDPAIYEGIAGLNPEMRWHRYCPLYSYAVYQTLTKTAVISLLRRGSREWGEVGPGEDNYAPLDATWDGRFDKIKKEDASSLKFEITPDGSNILKQIIVFAQEREIPLVLVFSPEYYEARNYVVNREKVFSFLRSLANEYNVHFLDYSQEESMTFERRYFRDSQHLNREGSRHFTRLLGKDIARLFPFLQDPLMGNGMEHRAK